MKRILIFGGSFDPIHDGHIYIAKKAMKFINADKCYFLPAKTPNLKTVTTSYLHRLEMLKIALKDYPEFDISLEEINSTAEVNYTYDTINKLVQKENACYYLLIGTDQASNLDKWYKSVELSNLCSIVVYKRNGYNLNESIIKKYNLNLINDEPLDVSSTDIRLMKCFKTNIDVLEYIAKNQLYYVSRLKTFLSDKRLAHSLSVAKIAYLIAKNNNLDYSLAYQSGLLHDIAKELSKNEAEKIFKEKYSQYSYLKPFAYHQFLAIDVIKEQLNINNEKLFNAIKYHCTGNEKMSDIGLIVYSADKIDPLRGYDSKFMIDECLKNYLEGFKLVLKENIEFYIEKKIDYKNELTLKCINYYLKKETL